MVIRDKRIGAITCILALVICLAGCRQPGVSRTAGSTERPSAADVNAGLKVAREYVEAWAEKDYKRMYTMQSPRSMDYAKGHYKYFNRIVSGWRTIGAPKSVGIKEPVSGAEINKTLRVVQNVTENQAKILLVLPLNGTENLDKLEKGTWPYASLFVYHKMCNKEYLMMLTKEGGKWYVMNAPGTLAFPAELTR